MGDGIQAAKAGILEIADILVVNKSDHDGASGTVRDLKGMLALGRSGRAPAGDWRVPVVSTVASTGTGLDELLTALSDHRRHLDTGGGAVVRRQQRAEMAIEAVTVERVQAALHSEAGRAAAHRRRPRGRRRRPLITTRRRRRCSPGCRGRPRLPTPKAALEF